MGRTGLELTVYTGAFLSVLRPAYMGEEFLPRETLQTELQGPPARRERAQDSRGEGSRRGGFHVQMMMFSIQVGNLRVPRR